MNKGFQLLEIEAALEAVESAFDDVSHVLAENEGVYQKIVKGEASIVITDLTGCIVYVNRKCCESTRYSAEEMLGQSPRIFKSGHMSKQEYRQVWGALVAGNEWSGELLNRKKNGILFWEHALISPLRDEHGDITHFICVKEDITERKRSEEQLREYRGQLRSLASELSSAEQRERRRIASLLHNDIIQSLALVNMKMGELLETNLGPDQGADLDSIRTLIKQTIQQTRSLTYQLSPPILHELGLEPAFEWLTETFRIQYKLNCRFEDDKQEKHFEEDLRNFLFMAVRKLLFNVIKYAEASAAKISIRKEDDKALIVVEDDGKGFDPSRVATGKMSGFGFFHIRERLSYLGGSLDVDSEPGCGTRVTLIVPLSV